jgi:hypothetical protein|tara:strand:+ start:355 stop:570 length:216 start_codon:yes stop_codon:yes gene_type:complete
MNALDPDKIKAIDDYTLEQWKEACETLAYALSSGDTDFIEVADKYVAYFTHCAIKRRQHVIAACRNKETTP